MKFLFLSNDEHKNSITIGNKQDPTIIYIKWVDSWTKTMLKILKPALPFKVSSPAHNFFLLSSKKKIITEYKKLNISIIFIQFHKVLMKKIKHE